MTTKRPSREPDPESQHCVRCSQIPMHCWECTCAGKTSGNIPEEIGGLVFVGPAPHPAADRGKSLKICPDCGAYYEQELDYEFLVPASESTTTYTRLPRSKGKAWEREILGT